MILTFLTHVRHGEATVRIVRTITTSVGQGAIAPVAVTGSTVEALVIITLSCGSQAAILSCVSFLTDTDKFATFQDIIAVLHVGGARTKRPTARMALVKVLWLCRCSRDQQQRHCNESDHGSLVLGVCFDPFLSRNPLDTTTSKIQCSHAKSEPRIHGVRNLVRLQTLFRWTDNPWFDRQKDARSISPNRSVQRKNRHFAMAAVCSY